MSVDKATFDGGVNVAGLAILAVMAMNLAICFLILIVLAVWHVVEGRERKRRPPRREGDRVTKTGG